MAVEMTPQAMPVRELAPAVNASRLERIIDIAEPDPLSAMWPLLEEGSD